MTDKKIVAPRREPTTPPVKKDDVIFSLLSGIGVKGTPYVKYLGYVIFLNKTLGDPTDSLKMRRVRIQNTTQKFGFGEEIETNEA